MNGPPIASDLLVQRNLELLGLRFTSLWPVDDTPCFQGLLEAIDEDDLERQDQSRPRVSIKADPPLP
jgi:hypothetical protein